MAEVTKVLRFATGRKRDLNVSKKRKKRKRGLRKRKGY